MSDAIQSAILAAFSAALERAISQAVATHVEDLQARLDALADRIDTAGGLADRMAKLETVAAATEAQFMAARERIAQLETKLTEANLFTQMVPATPTTDITQYIINALGDIEHPLFKRMSSFMDAVVEQSMDHHCETYDHDSYDSAVSDFEDVDFDDLVTKGDVGEAVREALDGQSFTISL